MVEIGVYLHLTGNVCHQWSYLDLLLSKAVWHLLDLDKETGIIVTGGMDMLPRVNMGVALARHLKSDRRLLGALIDARKSIQGKGKTDGLLYKRNRVVHGVYSSNDNAVHPMIETHRGAGNRKRHPITPDEIKEVGSSIFATSGKLIEVFELLGIDTH